MAQGCFRAGGGGGSSVYGVIELVNVQQTTLNSGADSFTQQVQWNTTPAVNIGNWTVTAAGVEIVDAGVYRISGELSSQSSSTRTNLGARVAINGSLTGPYGTSSYIRNSSGHNHASTDFGGIVRSLSPGDQISVLAGQFGGGGTVTTNAGRSVLLVERVA